MLAAFLKTSGVDQLATHSLVLIAIAMSTVAFLLGWLANWVTRAVSFGVLTNAVILIASMIGGIVAYNQKVAPLKSTDPGLLVALAIGSAVLGLFVILFVKARPYRA